MSTATDNATEFEAAAERAIVEGLGASTLETFRRLVEAWGPAMAAVTAADAMKLSPNDERIFRAVAFKLHREGIAAVQESTDAA
jgi:hypothetical protein